MALVSPGISISINDQSQYVNSNVGSVPLVVLATAQDKTYNSAPATGTSKANAGKLLAFTSQRDLVTQMGTPTFQLSSAGTPVNGSEVNEYGLLAAYSALGLTNQLFAIRADIDLNQLTGTSVRPVDVPANGTYWVNTASTNWGVYSLDAVNSVFDQETPLIISNPAQVANDSNGVPTPVASVGQVGNYALVFTTTTGTTPTAIRLFFKAGTTSAGLNNTWVQVGSTNWQLSVPTVTGLNVSPTIPASSTLTINTITVTSSSTTTVAALATSINSAMNTHGVYASVSSSGQLQLFATNAATSNGSVADGKLVLTDGTNTPLALSGITAGTYYSPYLFYGNYAQEPSGGWFTTDSQPRPSGSVWFKTTNIGSGYTPVLSQFNTASGGFTSLSAPAYATIPLAIYGLDPTGGGVNIPIGTVVTEFNPRDIDATYSSNVLTYYVTTGSGAAVGTGTPSTAGAVVAGTFTLSATTPGSSAYTAYTITVSGTGLTDFVGAVLGANIPYVTATVNTNGTISISHTSGGKILLLDGTNHTLASAGFTNTTTGSGFTYNSLTGYISISNWVNITSQIDFQASQPYTKPATGTYWYWSDPTQVDIMINTGTAWNGYRNVTRDNRGYNLSQTDANGVIVSASQPTSQSNGNALVPGDLWLNTSDLANFPALSRVTSVVSGVATWTAINNTDHTSSNGIIFADARWDSTGTTDIITGNFPSTVTMLTSNYTDLDAPNPLLYPRGTLLFNTRRSGYNVKQYVPGYFNSTSFPNSTLPTEVDAWVTASGLDSNGVMYAGSAAQRSLVVDAMQAAVDSNLDALSPTYAFNLIVAPNYPELIPNMLTLNDNRGDTAFVIGDTPLDLAPNTVDITNWVNNTSGNGLPSDASASPYLALYYPSGLTNDLSGNQVVVPASHAVLRTYLYNDQIAYPWFAPAGANRGVVSNLSDIGYIDSTSGLFVHNAISQGLRDALFDLNINPITQLPGSGLVVWGQLTRSLDTTARNRVNVVRLENYLRTIFASVSNGYLFEPNDAITRKSIATQIENALNNVLALRGLYDYLVICDTSNNTSATIANNQLYVDVAIEPMKDVEFIYIPIAIYNPGQIAQLNTQSS